MTAEEFIKSKVINDNGYDKHPCEMVSKFDALTAIAMARDEERQNKVGLQGWVCPKCRRVYSPYTSSCSFCQNSDLFKVTCKI